MTTKIEPSNDEDVVNRAYLVSNYEVIYYGEKMNSVNLNCVTTNNLRKKFQLKELLNQLSKYFLIPGFVINLKTQVKRKIIRLLKNVKNLPNILLFGKQNDLS